MPYSKPVAVLKMALTDEEKAALQEIAATENVSMSRIVRELLAERYDSFRAVTEPRFGEGTATPR